MASLGELFIQLAFEGDTKGAEEFQKKVNEVAETLQKNVKEALENNEALKDLSESTNDNTDADKNNTEAKEQNTKAMAAAIKGLRNYALAISGAIYAIHRLTDSLLKENQQWLNLTRTSDIALETFQKWDSVGKTLGIDNAADQIKNLNDRLFEMRLTGQGARGFVLAGINPTNAEDVMEQLRNRVAGLDDTSASYILKQMGLDPNMLHILRMSREEFASINAELSKYRLTPQQRRDLQMFNLQIQIASQKLQYLKQKAILAIMPAWTKFMQSLARVTEGLSWFVGRLKDALNTMPSVISGIIKIAGAVGILWKAMQLLKLDPIYLAISGIVALIYLLIDDIVGYFQGKRSAIGALLYAFEHFEEKINFETPAWVKDLLLLAKEAGKINSIWRNKDKSTSEKIEDTATAVIGTEIATVENHPLLKEAAKRLMANPFIAAPLAIGTAGTLAIKNADKQVINSNTNNNKSTQNDIHIENYINTNETQKEVVDSLGYALNAFAGT